MTLLFMGAAGGGVWGQEVHPVPGPTLDSLLQQARALARPLYLYVGPCDSAALVYMERTIWSDPSVRQAVADVYTVGCIEMASPEGCAVLERYALTDSLPAGVPVHLFIAPGGQILHRTVGPEEQSAQFAVMLAAAAERALVEDGQYYTLRRRYALGDRGDDLLFKYAQAAREAAAVEAPSIEQEFLQAIEAYHSNNATTTPGMPPPDSRQGDRRR